MSAIPADIHVHQLARRCCDGRTGHLRHYAGEWCEAQHHVCKFQTISQQAERLLPASTCVSGSYIRHPCSRLCCLLIPSRHNPAFVASSHTPAQPAAVCGTCLLQYVRCPISTLCVGQAASMASLLLAAGEPGERRCLPNARIMVHQPIGGAQVSTVGVIFAACPGWRPCACLSVEQLWWAGRGVCQPCA